MVQNVKDELLLNGGYKIDEQFLICLRNIIQEYDNNAEILINIWCKKYKFTFESIDEFIEKSSILKERIEKMEILVKFKRDESYICDELKMSFSNECDAAIFNAKISFDFNNTQGYYILKNGIQTLMKNYKLSYSFFSRIAIFPIISIFLFVAICWYTIEKNIIFPKVVQNMVYFLTALGLVIPLIYPFKKIKRYVFPLHEFEFGVNILSNSKSNSIRQIFLISIILTFVMGIIVNVVSHFIIN